MDLSPQPQSAPALNPIDGLEQIINSQDWPYERNAEEELHVTVPGSWCDYHLSFNWRPDLEALHIAATMDLKAAQDRRGELYKLLALVNEQLWIGHFDLWSEDRVLMFRHGMLLHGGASVNAEQSEALVRLPVEACERFFPAFQYVLWAGKSSKEALEACLFETEGEA